MKFIKTKLLIVFMTLGLFVSGNAAQALCFNGSSSSDPCGGSWITYPHQVVWSFANATTYIRVLLVKNLIASVLFYLAEIAAILLLFAFISQIKKLRRLHLGEVTLWLFGLAVYVFFVGHLYAFYTYHHPRTACIDYCDEPTVLPWYGQPLFFLNIKF